MKRFCLLIIALMLALTCGCSVLREDNDISQIPDMNAVYQYKSGRYSYTVYRYNEKAEVYQGVLRDITVNPGESREMLLINEVLKTVENKAVSTGPSLENIEVLDDVIYVYINNAPAGDGRKYILGAQIADTLYDAGMAEFVCLFYDDMPLNIGGYAVGALTKSEGDPYNDYAKLIRRHSELNYLKGDVSLYIPLCFTNSSYEYFIPETRTVTVTGPFSGSDDFNRAVIKRMVEEISMGPERKYYLNSFITGEYVAKGGAIDLDGNTLTVQSGEGIFTTGYNSEKAALYYTAGGVVPVNELIISEAGAQRSITRDHADDYAGAQITIYIPNRTGDGLERRMRVVSEDRAREIITYAQEVFIAIEESGYYKDKAGFTSAYVGGAHIAEDVAVVDLTGKFFTLTAGLDEDIQRLVVFALVNSLEASGKVKLAAIRNNGSVPKNFGGDIDFEYPLMPNHGLVKQA